MRVKKLRFPNRWQEGRQNTEQRRILSSTLGSEPLGKFSTLLDSSMAYKNTDSHRRDPFCRVLNMELLQFYYSVRATGRLANLVGERPRVYNGNSQ
jgi:hypothetical protein